MCSLLLLWYLVDMLICGVMRVCAQLANKQDWARYHSYEVHQMAELVDSHLRPGALAEGRLLQDRSEHLFFLQHHLHLDKRPAGESALVGL